jgi:hypothetical protein
MNQDPRKSLIKLGQELESLLESSSEDELRTFLLDITVLRGEVNRLFSDERFEGQLLH